MPNGITTEYLREKYPHLMAYSDKLANNGDDDETPIGTPEGNAKVFGTPVDHLVTDELDTKFEQVDVITHLVMVNFFEQWQCLFSSEYRYEAQEFMDEAAAIFNDDMFNLQIVQAKSTMLVRKGDNHHA